MSVGSGEACGIMMWNNGVHIFYHWIELWMQFGCQNLKWKCVFSLCCSLIWHFLCDLWVFHELSKVWSLVTNCAHCNVCHILKNCGMKVNKPPKHTNCTTRLLHLDFRFVSEDAIDWNLSRINKGNALSRLQLNSKKKGKTFFFKHFTFFVEAMVFT
jgi:hypothetical protein